jgi:tail assembly chaperone
VIELEVDGRRFRLEKPNAMEQLHLTRKLAPLLPALAPVIDRVREDLQKGMKVDEDLTALAELSQGFADQLAAMKNEDAEYVFDICLSALMVEHNGNWVNFWAKQAKMPMVKELNDAALLLRLVLRVLRETLGNFISGFLMSAQEPEVKA